MKIVRSLIVLSLLFTTACASGTTIRSKSNYENELKAKKTIAVLPATAEVYSQGLGKKERFHDYESNLEELINSEIVALFKAKGYNVRNLKKQDIHTKGISGQVVDFKRSFTSKASFLHNPALMKTTLALNTNLTLDKKSSNAIQKASESDVIAVVSYIGTVQNNSARALNFAVGLLTNNYSSVERSTLIVSLIDADTANLLWSNMEIAGKNFITSGISNLSSQEKADAKNINHLGYNLLKDLPDNALLGLTKEQKTLATSNNP